MNTAIRKRIQLTMLMGALIAVIAGITIAISLQARAATVSVTPGTGTLQNAITSADSGDTLTLSAGEYIGDVAYHSKSLTIVGVAGTVIKTGGGTARFGVKVDGATSTTIKNVVIDGGSQSPTQTGLDLNSNGSVTLENVTVKNYGKNGIAVTSSFSAPGAEYESTPTTSVVFTNVTTDNTDWAGIALYPSSTGPVANLLGVVFNGTTTVTNSQYGIQLGEDTSTASAVTGVDGAPVDLGNLVLADNARSISGSPVVLASVAATSTIDGQPVTAALLDANITIETETTSVVPGVPNTATARQ